jgi:hypothetical protein
MDPLQLQIEQTPSGFTVQTTVPIFPGAMRIGTGLTKEDAIIAFFVRQKVDDLAIIKKHADAGVFINGEPWQDMNCQTR